LEASNVAARSWALCEAILVVCWVFVFLME